MVLATVAVTVFLAITEPEPLTARTSNVWLPSLTEVDVPEARCCHQTGFRSRSDTTVPSTTRLDRARIVLDTIAVLVVHPTRIHDTLQRRTVRDRLLHRAGERLGGALALATVAVTVFLAITEPEPLTARTSNVWLPVLDRGRCPRSRCCHQTGFRSRSDTTVPSTTNWTEPGSSSTPSPFLSYTARQFTTPFNVAPFAIDCFTAPVEPGRRGRPGCFTAPARAGRRGRRLRHRTRRAGRRGRRLRHRTRRAGRRRRAR